LVIIKITMRSFIEPTELAVFKKLQLESKGDYRSKEYKGDDFWRWHFNVYQNDLLVALKSLEGKGYLKVGNFKFSKDYIYERENMKSIGSWGSSSSYKPDPFLGFGKELYKKMKNGLELTWDEVMDLRKKIGFTKGDHFYENITFGLDFPDKAKKISSLLRDYSRDFITGEVVSSGTGRYYSYFVQKQGVLRTIGRLAIFYGVKNLTINGTDLWTETQPYNETVHKSNLAQTRFLETVLALELEKLIRVEEVLGEGSIRLSILPVSMVPKMDEWTADFYRIASNLASYKYIIKKRINNSNDRPRLQVKVLEWDGFKLDLGSGWGVMNGVKHVFRPGKDHYKVLKILLEANGEPVSYDQFFAAVSPALVDNPKNGKEYIRQKVRDIRKYFKINRRKNRENDIFYDTGDGFRLMKVTE